MGQRETTLGKSDRVAEVALGRVEPPEAQQSMSHAVRVIEPFGEPNPFL